MTSSGCGAIRGGIEIEGRARPFRATLSNLMNVSFSRSLAAFGVRYALGPVHTN